MATWRRRFPVVLACPGIAPNQGPKLARQFVSNGFILYVLSQRCRQSTVASSGGLVRFSAQEQAVALSESQKGRVVEQLVGAVLILQSDGALRVSLPLVDDEGVDLVVGNRSNDKSLLLQVKSRFSLTGRGYYRADVRRATCTPNSNKFLLFVFYEPLAAGLGEMCWLVPSPEFCTLLSRQKATRAVYVFASTFKGKGDMWVPFRIRLKDVAAEILKVLR